MNWSQLSFDSGRVATNLHELLVAPIRGIAGKTIDVWAVLAGFLTPWVSTGDRVAANYRKYLFGKKTLQDLPDTPRFVINATNLQSGVLWRFMKPYMRDYHVGEVPNPTITLATAVAASSAFPPVLSPVRLKLRSSQFTPNSGEDLGANRSRRALCSRTAVFTTTSAWRRRGSGFKRCSSATRARRCRPRRGPEAIGRGSRCACSTSSTTRYAACASAS